MDTVIWLVTSDANLRQKLPALLQAMGYTSRLFKLPKSALHTLMHEEAPPAILLDHTALDLLSKIREQPRFVHLAVVVIAPVMNEAYLERLQEQGADGGLYKPVTAPALEKALTAALKRRRAMAG